MESGRQFASVELRIMSRTWDGAHIDQPPYLVCFQDVDELLCRARGMPDVMTINGVGDAHSFMSDTHPES